jgi:glycyl-tRNA synthetase
MNCDQIPNQNATLVTLNQIISYCKSKGYIFPSSDIYDGISGFFDYGHLGVQLKKNIVDSYFANFVWKHHNIIAQDGSIISNPNVWKASGHVDQFNDPMLVTETGKRERADHFIEETLNIPADGLQPDELKQLIRKNNLTYQGEKIVEVEKLNLMFTSSLSHIPMDSGLHRKPEDIIYLRPETCQNIFCNAKYLAEVNRLSLPFGIVQVGKVFRNEIAPRNFIFRCREFEQIEMEYFYNPKSTADYLFDGLLSSVHNDFTIDCKFASGVTEHIQLRELLNRNLVNGHHLYWIAEMLMWLLTLGFNKSKLRIREHCKDELSHYSSATFDVDFKYPFGDSGEQFKELCGIANRGCYDISQHAKFSKKNLLFFDETTKEKLYPNVIEPSIGVERLFLAVLCNGYNYDNDREYIVMKLEPRLCVYEFAVLPLVNKFHEKGREVYACLAETGKRIFYDKSGAIGRRYARQDEIGTKWCVTIDGETLENDTVTLRDRDTQNQLRVNFRELTEKPAWALFKLYELRKG